MFKIVALSSLLAFGYLLGDGITTTTEIVYEQVN